MSFPGVKKPSKSLSSQKVTFCTPTATGSPVTGRSLSSVTYKGWPSGEAGQPGVPVAGSGEKKDVINHAPNSTVVSCPGRIVRSWVKAPLPGLSACSVVRIAAS